MVSETNSAERDRAPEFDMEAVTYPSLLEEILASLLPCCVACSVQMLHVDKSGAREHDGLEKDQADFAFASILPIDDSQEIVQIQKRHVRMDKFDVCTKHFATQLAFGQCQCTLLFQIRDLISTDLGWQRLDKPW